AGLEMGLAALDPALRARTVVRAGPAAAHTEVLAGADVVIVDPPRKGLDAAVLAALVPRPPVPLGVVSCSLPAFLYETRTLCESGRLRLAALVPFALFPYTPHVETVALFERV